MRKIKNRKVRNREIERQRKARSRMVAVIAVFTAAAVIAAISWVIWDMQSKNWILQFEGQRIHTNEMRLFMGNNSPEAKQQALDALIETLTLIERAERHGLGLTEEEREMWAWYVAMEYGGETMLPPERMGEFMAAASGEIWMRLMDYYVPEMMAFIDEEQFAFDLEFYRETNFTDYIKMEIMYVFMEEPELAEDAHARLLAGEVTFEEIIREFNPWYDENEIEEIDTMSIHDFLNEAMLYGEDADALLALQAGEMSEMLTWGEEYGMDYKMLVYVISREEPEDNEIAAGLRGRLVAEQRYNMMLSLVPQWVEQANYTVNQRAFTHI